MLNSRLYSFKNAENNSCVDSSSSSSTFYYLTLLMIDMHILMKNNSSYGIKDCIYIYFPAIHYQIPYVIISPWVTSEYHYNLFQLSLLLESFVIAFRLNAPFLIKCYYRQLSVFSITENNILVEITRIIGTGLLNGPMKA